MLLELSRGVKKSEKNMHEEGRINNGMIKGGGEESDSKIHQKQIKDGEEEEIMKCKGEEEETEN